MRKLSLIVIEFAQGHCSRNPNIFFSTVLNSANSLMSLWEDTLHPHSKSVHGGAGTWWRTSIHFVVSLDTESSSGIGQRLPSFLIEQMLNFHCSYQKANVLSGWVAEVVNCKPRAARDYLLGTWRNLRIKGLIRTGPEYGQCSASPWSQSETNATLDALAP